MNEATSVYIYRDEFGTLIYVGITGRGSARQREHNRSKAWWQYVSTQEVEHYGTRLEALARESELIRTHMPPYNVQQNSGQAALQRVYETMRSEAQIERADALAAIEANGWSVSVTGARDRNGDCVFVTPPMLAAVTLASPLKTVKVLPKGDGAVGSVSNIERHGMLTRLYAQVRSGIDVSSASLSFKRRTCVGGQLELLPYRIVLPATYIGGKRKSA